MPRLRAPVRPLPQRAWLITVPLAAAAILLTVAAQAGHSVPAERWAVAALYFGLFLAAEQTNVQFEVRRQRWNASLSEVPLLLALFYLPPLPIVVARSTAQLIVYLRRARTPEKVWFNVANAGAATAVAILVTQTLVLLKGDAGPRSWLVLTAAVAANALVTTCTVTGVIALVQGRIPTGHLVRAAVSGFAVSSVNIVLGLAVLLIIQQSPWAVVLLVALLSISVLLYRSYQQLMSQHRRLTELYDLVRAVRAAPDGMLYDVVLRHVRQLLRAEYATLWLPAKGRHLEVRLSARADDEGLVDVVLTPDSMRRRAVEQDRIVAAGPKIGDEETQQELQRAGVKDAIVVPLHSGSAVIGTLEVAGRLGDDSASQFTKGDVQLLETVAVHAAVAVENSRLVDRLRYDAYHDGLTGLPNRRRTTEALEESVAVRAPGEVVAVLLFDVDRLRDVNESLGHAAGDKLLIEVANRLRTHAPPAALVGRVGGDEFVVTLRAESAEAAAELAVELRGLVCDPMVFDALTLDVDLAIGVAVHPDHGSDPETLLRRADVAVTAAKGQPGGVQVFSVGLESRSVRRLELAGDLRRALDDGQLEVYFQPKVTLTDRRLVGVECLARWEHPAHGAVAPEDFVAVAEHTGQLGRLTEAVLREGLRRCRDWADADRPLSIAVNLSPRTLVDPAFPAQVEALLGEYGVPPEQVTFEIKEDGVTGPTDRPIPTLRRLRDLGVRLAVDDFGTGYSSLSYLRRLPVHEVKIDRTFVQGMATDPGDHAIVRAVVALSLQFGLTVVAEGVESELTLDLLKDMGCEIGQGFLFSRPLPYERLEAWFNARTETEPTPLGEVRKLRAVT
ncbi:sensor domain-containing phosphodiesterase [Actinomycetes bacterium KLBMP 9797]